MDKHRLVRNRYNMEKEISSIEEYFEIDFNVQKEIDEKNVWRGLIHTSIALRGQSDKHIIYSHL